MNYLIITLLKKTIHKIRLFEQSIFYNICLNNYILDCSITSKLQRSGSDEFKNS